MSDFTVKESTKEEAHFVAASLDDYNAAKVPFLRGLPVLAFNRVIKSENGEILAGINSVLNYWNCLHVLFLWVREDCRHQGYGTALIREVETAAKEKGCRLIQLETYDFQAKNFYELLGYEIFGILEESAPGHNEYFLKKTI